jgi:regulator of protease activity HflC (stomatin/prohibitin superfamily)
MIDIGSEGYTMIDLIKKILVGVVLYGAMICIFSLHQIEEGHVGLTKRFGRLMPRLYEPGFHLFVPFVHEFISIRTSVQTDTVTNIPCGTSGGVLVNFKTIEVVNRLRKSHAY